MEINDKTALVTGGGGEGSGRAIGRTLAGYGANVVVCDIDENAGRESVRQIRADGGKASFLRADIAKESEVAAVIAFAEETYGGLDILVNNASAVHQEGPFDHWLETIQVDLLGAMFAILHGREAMRRRGGGAVVNIGSSSALGHGSKNSQWAAYDAAKAGIIRLTTSLAWLGLQERIRVNCFVPDWIATPEVSSFVTGLTASQRQQWAVPPALTSVDEVADAVVHLITDDTLSGRILVWWSGQARQLIQKDDPGYAVLE